MDKRKTLVKLVAMCAAFLSFAGVADAQWTPTKPGDPRVCPGFKPAQCAEYAAEQAFKAKYQRVEGRGFVGELQCPATTNLLNAMCAWENSLGKNQTVVRFTHKKAGWKVAVGLIPTS